MNQRFKRSLSWVLSLSLVCGMMATAAPALAVGESAPPAGLTRTDLFEPKDMQDFGVTDPKAPTRHTHGLTLTELPSGDLFAVWFSSNPGGERDANECRLIGAWLPKAEIGKENAKWTAPFEVYNQHGVPSNNPVAYVDENGRLWVFFNMILNGQWVSAMPKYIYADPEQYTAAIAAGKNPEWHFAEQMYVTVGDTYGKQGKWNGTEFVYEAKSDIIRHISMADHEAHPEVPGVEVQSRFSDDTRYITDRFVVGIQNQVDAAVAYLEKEKPYDDEFGQRNDIVLQSVNEGIFTTAPYKSEPSLRDGAIWRASGADNDLKTWNPAFRRIGWQTKNAPLEFKLPAGQTLSNGGTSAGGETRLLLPLYSDSLALSICAYTDDNGATWAYSDPIAGLGNIQGALVQKDDGTLYQYFRSGKLDGKNGRLDWKITRSESKDYGVTWKNIHVEDYLRNDGGVGLTELSDGTWVMAHNQETKEDLREGTRASVTLSASKDQGATWQSIMLDTDVQADGQFTDKDYQYPGVICTKEGWIVTAYTNGKGGPSDQQNISQVMRSTMLKESELDALLAMDLGMDATAAMAVGATMTPTHNTALDGDLIWRTTDKSVLTVSEAGEVKALKEGKAKIIATSKTYGTIGECLVTVGRSEPVAGTGVRLTAGDPVDIFAPVPNGTDHTHGSGIAALPDGELLTVWFQGNGERDGTTTRIMASRLPVDATEWTEPFVIADAQNIADINPTVYVDGEGRLWMFWYPVLSALWETSQPRYAYAEPGSYEFASIGNTVPKWEWSDTIPIKIGPNIGNPVDRETDEFIAIMRQKYAELNDYAYKAATDPGAGDTIYDETTGESFYEDKSTGGGVNEAIEKAEMDEYMVELLARIGDAERQAFTPTVADKVGPDKDGNVPRSGYPLLRRIGWQTKNQPLEIKVRAGTILSNGDVAVGGENRMIVPLYSDGLEMSINAITDDCGKTWKMSGPVVGMCTIQASMAQRENGDIVAFMRNNGPAPQRLTYSISKDDGETWAIAKTRTDLFDPGVGHCMTQLSGKDWVFVACSVETGRNVMSIALSENEGKTWPWRRTIELDTRSKTGSYHYPCVDVDAQGNIFISYSIDYANGEKAEDGSDLSGMNNIRVMKIDKGWIKAGDWSDKDTAGKAVFAYQGSIILADLPEGFDKTNKGADGKYAMEEIEKLAAVLPTSVKAYLTYDNHGEDGLAMAAPEYVEIPVTVDKDFLQQNFEIGKQIKGVPFVMGALPAGITAEMLPAAGPVIYALAFVG